MLALMTSIAECSWDKLPEAYRKCPHFNLDEHIIQQCSINIPENVNSCPLNTTLPEMNLDTSQEKSPNSQCQQEEEYSSTPIHLLLQAALGGLKDIQANLYLVNNSLDLQEINQKIIELKSFSTSKIQKDSGLPLNPTEKKSSLKRKSGNLSLRKKYRKLKKSHCVKLTEEEEDVIILDGTYDTPNLHGNNVAAESSVNELSVNLSCSATHDVDTLWRVKPSDYLVAKIGHYSITDSSINFLKTRVSDEV
jgi:hypothetical protein